MTTKIKRRDVLKGMAGGLALTAMEGTREAGASGHSLAPGALGILYDSTLCVGCNACMAACKAANEMPPEPAGPDDITTPAGEPISDRPLDLSSRTLNVIKKYESGQACNKDEVTDGYAFIKRQCLHCVDPSCVTACPVAALTKDEKTGIVRYNKNRCIGCRYCMVACPFHIPKFEWDKAYSKIVKCQLCSHLVEKGGISACCSACPTGASLFGKVEDLRKEARRRLQMTPGEHYEFPVTSLDSGRTHTAVAPKYIQHLYGEEEMGGTQVMYLSAVPFDKLGLEAFPKRSFASISNGIQTSLYKGLIFPVALLAGLSFLVKKHTRGDKILGEEHQAGSEATSQGGENHE